MTDKKDNKTLNVTGKKTLTLKVSSVSKSSVRQNVNQGRVKSVVVETRKRRPHRQEDEKNPIVLKYSQPLESPSRNPQLVSKTSFKGGLKKNPYSEDVSSSQKRSSSSVSKQLSPEEIESRRRALIEAQLREVEEAQDKYEEESSVSPVITEAEISVGQVKKDNIDENVLSFDNTIDSSEGIDSTLPPMKLLDSEQDNSILRNKNRRPMEDESNSRVKSRSNVRGKNTVANSTKSVMRNKGEEEKRRKKLKVTTDDFDDEGSSFRGRSLSAMRRRQEKIRRSQLQESREKISRDIILPETITIQELSQRMSERSADVIKFLMKEGQMMKPGDVIDADLSEIIANEFGHTVKRVLESDVELGIFDTKDDEADLEVRSPVVTVMGHVDHGKTSLLDSIRQANVVKEEAGGITQHIGAYQVEKNGQKITFIDTPGHAAFTAMRARGAQVTDIAVIVLAADDGVMPQTVESIKHAKAANVPIIVAINKIDKPSANVQKVRTELLQYEVFVESMGGEVLDVEVSAKKGLHLDKLLDAVLLQAELLNLKTNLNRRAEGSIIEAKLDRGRGSVVTILVQNGILRLGQIIVAGDQWGRVRALFNDKGESVSEAMPSMPVEILGLQGIPTAGDKFVVIDSESRAREIAEYRQRLSREKSMARQSGLRGSIEKLMSDLYTSSGVKELPLIIKGDVQGSVEAIVNALEKLATDEVKVRIVHFSAGAINESDISLAQASDATVIGFNIRANSQARVLAERENIKVLYYNIIYDLVNEVKEVMSCMLKPEVRETFLGNAKIIELFNITKFGKIAGCKVLEGKVEKGSGVRLIRDKVVVYEGKLRMLKRFKDEVTEVSIGQECGIAFENYDNMQVGDMIECFRIEYIKRSL
ncbi:Translation initiation factor 2 [Liberibacter crescens BT-1]|uniref:Translation initiation factor IF-2 n=1 Tax=Liberibacter crescens (strain BT-1) TaxID=1215343 RepID=L0ETR9_LIBCB|nr:translation initiation factor IF-2 [Liberibacter crescens]AGA64023.1 Translation initiation factor 2 [Liberibacter crescens BT-1]AMC12331.1 translation initiation factor IF-2 [Liberibacter crescens]